MNCQEISRIADSGKFSDLREAERRAAEVHARSCRRCAAVWAAHVQLARLSIPPMPQEIALCAQALTSLAPQSVQGSRIRRLTVIGSLAALAAAAGMLMWRQDSAPPPKPLASAEGIASAAPQSIAPEVTSSASPADADAAARPPTDRAAAALPPLQLPRIPRPRSQPPDGEAAFAALEKILQRHPELVEGPPLADDTQFFVALAMRADGTVISSAAELGSYATYTETSERVAKTIPADTGVSLNTSFMKGPIPGGRTLRATTVMRTTTLPDTYDMARSEMRIREILGNKYAPLMLPVSGDSFNLLTIFLSEDGRITHEKVDHVDMQNAASLLGRGTMRNEDSIALALGVNVEQIGLMGMMQLEQGSRRMVVGLDGTSRLEGLRVLGIRYAWARRADEMKAYLRAAPRSANEETPIDVAAVRAVLQQLMPDAFSPRSTAAEMPTVVLTSRGEVIRAGWVQMKNGDSGPDQISRQLVPGMQFRSSAIRSVTIVDKAGAPVPVMLAWAD